MIDTEKKERCTEAVEKSKDVIRQAFKDYQSDEMAITWTGGKDSTLTLWIIRQTCLEDGLKMPKVMTIDEYHTFDEIHDFMNKYAKEWNLDLEWCRNDDLVKAAKEPRFKIHARFLAYLAHDGVHNRFVAVDVSTR